MKFFILAVLFLAFPALAQEAAATPAPDLLDKALALIDKSTAMVAGFLAVCEVLLRAFPSKKPLSLLVPAKRIIDGLVKILNFLSESILAPLINHAQKSEEKV